MWGLWNKPPVIVRVMLMSFRKWNYNASDCGVINVQIIFAELKMNVDLSENSWWLCFLKLFIIDCNQQFLSWLTSPYAQRKITCHNLKKQMLHCSALVTEQIYISHTCEITTGLWWNHPLKLYCFNIYYSSMAYKCVPQFHPETAGDN